jgi:DNA-binding transcriptional ArsR family regulator
MALAHVGYGPADDTRLRILLAIFETSVPGGHATFHELRERAGIGYGTLTHHLPGLQEAGYIERGQGARTLRLTRLGVSLLRGSDLIEQVALVPLYAISARGLELLESPRAKNADADGPADARSEIHAVAMGEDASSAMEEPSTYEADGPDIMAEGEL